MKLATVLTLLLAAAAQAGQYRAAAGEENLRMTRRLSKPEQENQQ